MTDHPTPELVETLRAQDKSAGEYRRLIKEIEVWKALLCRMQDRAERAEQRVRVLIVTTEPGEALIARLREQLRAVALIGPDYRAAHVTLDELEAALAQRSAPIPPDRSTREAELERILTAIIYASDQCQGHRSCGHSMQPWRDARALLFPEIEQDAPSSRPPSEVAPRQEKP